jgi:hypothetical protein
MSDLDSLSDSESPTTMMTGGASNFMAVNMQFDDDDYNDLDNNEVDDEYEIGQDYDYVNSPIKSSKKSNQMQDEYIKKAMSQPFGNNNDDYAYANVNGDEENDDLFDNESLGLSESTEFVLFWLNL